MSVRRSRPRRAGASPPRHRLSAVRQRQRLIDACISALHIYGPSRTTVARVVAIAKLSPGIVRFYFKSKGAMLVASLRFLATEFEQLVLEPVGSLRHSPVQALTRLVELYVDASVASTRKVSVWYAFWGEATARQEYQDICGQKDDRFADMVLELIERMIEHSGQTQLDADAISLGLIGVLEMMWQGFAFQAEEDIDREAARRRSMAYLSSIFPGYFPAHGVPAGLDGLPPERRFAEERARCFAPAWQLAGHTQELQARGDYLTIESATNRALLVRDATRTRAFVNSCPNQPHALVMSRRGQLAATIGCPLHRLNFALDGTPTDSAASAPLQPLELAVAAGLLFVTRADAAPLAQPLPGGEFAEASHAIDAAAAEFVEHEVPADWKIAIEQLLLHRMPEHAVQGGVQDFTAPELHVDLAAQMLSWRAVAGSGAHGAAWRRVYRWPNILLEWRPDGISAIQVVPLAAGHSRWQCLEYASRDAAPDGGGQGARARRAEALRLDIDLASSTQRGMASPGYRANHHGNVPAGIAAFREMLAVQLR
ncbi:MAG: TetR family transcriptional regulator C-terminal domain-containing protein [Proteobacteria bacterium]|nr:TetR family transcriptional regulator C-terminal domain-containing protein [Pseudomonadota bacterium]